MAVNHLLKYQHKSSDFLILRFVTTRQALRRCVLQHLCTMYMTMTIFCLLAWEEERSRRRSWRRVAGAEVGGLVLIALEKSFKCQLINSKHPVLGLTSFGTLFGGNLWTNCDAA